MTAAEIEFVRARLVERFGDRVRPSRSRSGAWVLDEVGELVLRVEPDRIGFRLWLPGGAFLDRLCGVDLSDVGSPVRLEVALDLLDAWASAVSDPGWSPRGRLIVDAAVEALRGDERRLLGLPFTSYPPLSRNGLAYECVHLTVSEHKNPDGAVDGAVVVVRGPFWREGTAGDERSFVHRVGDGDVAVDGPALEEVFEECVRQVLPPAFLAAYNDSYGRFASDGDRGWWASWGSLSDGLVGDDDLDIDSLSALVAERFGPRVSTPTIIDDEEGLTGRWVLDGLFVLVYTFREHRFEGDLRFPNGVQDASVLGYSVARSRNAGSAAACLARVDRFVSLLQGRAVS